MLETDWGLVRPGAPPSIMSLAWVSWVPNAVPVPGSCNHGPQGPERAPSSCRSQSLARRQPQEPGDLSLWLGSTTQLIHPLSLDSSYQRWSLFSPRSTLSFTSVISSRSTRLFRIFVQFPVHHSLYQLNIIQSFISSLCQHCTIP